MEHATRTKDFLKRTQRQFGKRLARDVASIADIWRRVEAGEPAADDLPTLVRLVHGLAGSGATFGYPAVSKVGQDLEAAVSPIAETQKPVTARQRKHVAELLVSLRHAARERAGAPDRAARTGSASRAGAAGNLIFLVEDDPQQVATIAGELTLFGYDVQRFSRPRTVLQAIARTLPAAVVIDIVLDGDRDAGFALAERLRKTAGRAIPLIFASTRNDFDARLTAIRAGADHYLVKPFDPILLIDCLDSITIPNRDPYRVLIVEDDRTLAASYAEALKSAGMRPVVVNDPRRLLDEMEALDPELIVMDVFLPECTGIELAKIIRQDDANTAVPIVFLSTEARIDEQLIAMSFGGDDFLTKPIALDQLVASVVSRAQRARALRSLMTRDSFTGLLNRASFLDQLTMALAGAKRTGGKLSVALLDIDRFKQINDTHGHAVGDRVIKSLARLMQQRLRKSDVIGRYGGEEFAVVLAGTGVAQAARVMDEVREAFGALRYNIEGDQLLVTFSCGVADLTSSPSASGLLEAADQALYRAKAAGRNRVEAAQRKTTK